MNIFKKYPPFKFLLVIFDLIVLNCSFAIALRLRFMPHIDVINLSEFAIAKEWAIFIMYSPIWIFFFQYLGLYKRHIIFTRSKQMVLIIKGIFLGFIGLILVQFIIRNPLRIMPTGIVLQSRLMFIYFLLICTFSLSIYRLFFIRPVFRIRWLKKVINERAVIIGAGKRGKLIALELTEEQEYQTQLVGFIDDFVEKGTIVFKGLAVLGPINKIDEIIELYNVSSIYLAIDKIFKNRLYHIISICLKRHSLIHISSELLDIIPEKVDIDRIRDCPVIRANSSSDGIYSTFFKSWIGRVLALIGVILISPMLIFITIGVKLSSPGPAIFKQKRVGKNGKLFDLYKFRSMITGSDDDESRKEEMIKLIKGEKKNCNTCLRACLSVDLSNAPAGQAGARSQASHRQNGSTKVINSSKVTKFGGFIRKYSLDELPQLFNVIKGDMNLVGPRPCLPYEYEVYDEWHKKRLDVKPGCTGLWQVSARSETSHDDMVVLDIYYLQNISPWLDLQLLLKTIPVLLSGKGGE